MALLGCDRHRRQSALDLRADKLDALTRDWNAVFPVLQRDDYAKVIAGLRDESESAEFTLRRITRLLVERTGNWPGLRDAISDDVVQEAIETHVSARDFLPFCRDFAMVAKLDYALQFWNELADYSYLRQALANQVETRVQAVLANAQARNRPVPAVLAASFGEFQRGDVSRWIGLLVEVSRNPQLKDVWYDARAPLIEATNDTLAKAVVRNQAGLLIAILRRVVMAYRGLIRGGAAAEGTSIGVGFSYLRSDDAEKRFALYELLSSGGDGRERGLRWLTDEIASWEMLA